MPDMRASNETPLKNKILANLFFEASTRSRMSFASAFMMLGGQVNSTTGVTFSSISKGESLEDTIRVISDYCDVLVIRHPEIGAAKTAASVSKVPVINAGDGPGEHPTQALLDLYTIYKEKAQLNSLTVTMVGDLKYGRTVHSLAKLLALYENINFIFAAPDAIQIPQKILDYIQEKGGTFQVTSDFKGAIKDADIIYTTRIQKERFNSPEDAEKVEGSYTINRALITEHCQSDVTIMHPLPRTTEIHPDVDTLPNAAYFRQAENGLYLRMGLFLETI